MVTVGWDSKDGMELLSKAEERSDVRERGGQFAYITEDNSKIQSAGTEASAVITPPNYARWLLPARPCCKCDGLQSWERY